MLKSDDWNYNRKVPLNDAYSGTFLIVLWHYSHRIAPQYFLYTFLYLREPRELLLELRVLLWLLLAL